MTAPTAPDTRPMTREQSSYLRDLLAKCDPAYTGEIRASLNRHRERGTLYIPVASLAIDAAKALSKAHPAPAAPVVVNPAPAAMAKVAQAARLPFPDVRPGRYAVEYQGLLRFYRVTRLDNGRTKIKRYVSESLTPITWAEGTPVLRMIEADPKAAALRFAVETTRCYVCNIRLTDTKPGGSVEKGIGPDCEAKGLAF